MNEAKMDGYLEASGNLEDRHASTDMMNLREPVDEPTGTMQDEVGGGT